MSDNLHVLKPGIDLHKSDDMQPQADAATQKMYADIAPAVVKIRGTDDAGTGFFIDKQGDIATDAHVVLGQNQLDVITADGKVLPAKIKALDDVDDVAIISVDKTPDNINVPKLAPDEKLSPDDHIWALGHPRGLDPIYISPGYYQHDTRPANIIAGEGKQAMAGALQKMFEMTPAERGDAKSALGRHLDEGKVHVEPGNSGGPVVDSQGNVVGLADMTDSDANTAVTPVSYLTSLMNEKNQKFSFGYQFVPKDKIENPVAPNGEYILTDISRADGDYRPPYSDPFFSGGDSGLHLDWSSEWRIPKDK